KLDLFVTGYGGNALYRNKGNCTFEDVTDKAGVPGGGFSTGAAWADYDRDGNVDLFVSRYVHVDMNNLPAFGSTRFCQFKGAPVQCGPWGMEGETDLLSTIAATAHSKKSQRKPVSTTPTDIMDWARPGATTITMAGPICSSPMTPLPT